MDDKNGTGKTTLDRRNLFKPQVLVWLRRIILTPREEARARRI